MALALLVVARTAEAAPPNIWLAPVGAFIPSDGGGYAPSDFMDMFRAGAPWDKAAAQVKVLKNTTRFVQIAPDTMLSAELQNLKARRIDYALETGVLPWSPTCGDNVEGFGAPGSAVELAKKIQRVGGTLNYLSMDEPLFFAHRYSGPNACHEPIEKIAQQVAAEVAALKRVFPEIRIGDIEPVAMVKSEDWGGDLMQWVAAYRAATGEPLGFVHADVNWFGPWQTQLRTLRTGLHAEGIPFGIIFIGDPSDSTDEEAARHAEERMVMVASDPALAPDQVIIQSWMRHPEHNLPETQPGTMTYLVDRYLAAPTRLSAQRDGARIDGQLSDDGGHPVGGARIEIAAVDNGKGQITNVRTLSGTVPPNAASAVLGIRINKECDCSGAADFGIGALRYTNRGSGVVIERTFGPASGQATAGRVVVAKGQQFATNAAPFPVSPGASYSVDVPMRVSHGSEGSGYVTIIFLDRQGNGFKRDELPLQATTHSVGQAVTSAAGRFSLPVDPALLRSAPGFDVKFAGDTRYRLSEAFLP